MKLIFDGTSWWGVCFWDHFLKILQIWLPCWCHQPKNGSKRSKLVFHVPMLIERWKSKAKWTLRWRIHSWHYFSKSWNSSPMLWHHHWVKMTQICISCTTGGINIKSRNFNNFGSKNFFLMEKFLNFETLILAVMSLFYLHVMYELEPFLINF